MIYIICKLLLSSCDITDAEYTVIPVTAVTVELRMGTQ